MDNNIALLATDITISCLTGDLHFFMALFPFVEKNKNQAAGLFSRW
jgi:hypothetical protein